MHSLTFMRSAFALAVCAALGCGGNPPAAAPTPAPTPPPAPGDVKAETPAAPPVASGTSAGGEAPNDNEHPQHAECTLKTRDIPGKEGGTRFMSCPAGCTKSSGTVWGTDVYTDDSAVCGAAIHAGAIPDGGGKVLITFVAGGKLYVGTERNGITTSDWGSWGRSFYVQAVDAAGKPTSKPPAPMDLTKPNIGCTTTADVVKDLGVSRVVCPAGCKSGSGYGSGPYTSDSSVCAAARQQGVLKDGGEVSVKLLPATKNFKGANKNGVSTADWAGEHVAFSVAK